jgi:hypothetical protein
MKKAILMGVVIFGALYVWHRRSDIKEYFDPAETRPLRAVVADANNMMRRQGAGITSLLANAQDYMGANGLVDFDVYHPSRLKTSYAAARSKKEYETQLAIANGEVLGEEAVEVRATQNRLQRKKYLQGPGYIRVEGSIKGSGPAGIPKPADHKNDKTAMEVRGRSDVPYLALLIQTCADGQGCSPLTTIADKSLVCGSQGYLYAWFNEFVEDVQGPADWVFNGNVYNGGSYTISMEKNDAAVAACAAIAERRLARK